MGAVTDDVTARWGKRPDTRVHEVDPFNAEPTPAALAASPTTPADTFYVRSHGPVPELDPAAWRLVVDGALPQRLELGLGELQDRFEHHQLTATLVCAGNRRAGLIAVRDIPGEDPWGRCAASTARWTGVRLVDVLAAAGITHDHGAAGDGAAGDEGHVAFGAPDVSRIPDPPEPYAASIPLTKALHPDTLLAWAMNDGPLTAVHGAPLRVVVPGWIGARSVKWLQRITVQAAPSAGHFQANAYRVQPADADPHTAGPDDGISLTSIALSSELLIPADGATVPAGTLELRGYAVAGDDRTVERVDVSLDGGSSWVQAQLTPTAGPWAWRTWSAAVPVAPGEVTVTVRAWDSTAAVQPESAAQLWNPKGYANNAWSHTRVHVTD